MGSAGTQSSTSSTTSQNWSESLSEYFSNAFSQNSSISQNNSQSGTSESRLSTMQGDILQNRENIFNNYFFPELQSAVNETKSGSAANKAVMEQNANAVNTAYDAAQKATDQTIAQQGLTNSPTGVGAALKAANNRARASSLAQAYYNQIAQSQANKATLLNSMASLMPSTTNSAEYLSSSTSQGTSSSQGTSTSESAGTSKAQSEGRSNSRSSGSSTRVGFFS